MVLHEIKNPGAKGYGIKLKIILTIVEGSLVVKIRKSTSIELKPQLRTNPVPKAIIKYPSMVIIRAKFAFFDLPLDSENTKLIFSPIITSKLKLKTTLRIDEKRDVRKIRTF